MLRILRWLEKIATIPLQWLVTLAGKRNTSCSFCGKGQDDVSFMIAGPGVYICNECLDLCNEILEDPETKKSSDEKLKCSFCGKNKRQTEKLIGGSGVCICNECVGLCNEILEEKRRKQKDD